jgi:hypothetical protein
MAIATLLDDGQRAALLLRLRALRPDSRPLWGRLDAPRMLCHVGDQLRVAVGDLPTRPTGSLLMRTLVKNLVVNTAIRPPRAKIETAPEMLSSQPGEWEADLAACEALVERVAVGECRAVHPAFGPLSPAEWGRLCWKHTDHHLRQFGV